MMSILNKSVGAMGAGRVPHIDMESLAVATESSNSELGEVVILKLAQLEERLDVLESFRPAFLSHCFIERQEKPAKVWKTLKTCVAAYGSLRTLEEKMHHGKFLEYLTISLGMLSGSDKEGRPIIWLRAVRDIYKLKSGSAEFCSYVRAQLWLIQIARLKAGDGFDICLLIDDSNRKTLDFNLAISYEVTTTSVAISPFRSDRVIVFAGNRFLKMAVGVATDLAGETKSRISCLEHKEDIRSIVADTNDIPNWWWDTQGKVEMSQLHRNSLWEWERCLKLGKATTTAKDIYNPSEPWIATEKNSAPASAWTRPLPGLEAIQESEEAS
jgi:hypothetical protein